jgi:hypothetical protein
MVLCDIARWITVLLSWRSIRNNRNFTWDWIMDLEEDRRQKHIAYCTKSSISQLSHPNRGR